MVRMGFTRAYGTSLRTALAEGTSNRMRAFFAGLSVTAVLQSSTAATLLLTSFAKRGLVTLPAALAVMLGADVSTTLVAQVLSFDLSWLSPVLLIGGFLAHARFSRGGRKNHIAKAMIGLGLMLLALALIRDAVEPLKQAEILPVILNALYKDPVLALIISAVLTWVLHSSLAAVLLFASLASTGVIDLNLGLLFVLGANLGGAFIPFVATYAEGSAVRQITFGNVLMRFVMLIAVAPFISEAHALLSAEGIDPMRQILHFHTGFNLLLAAFFLPLVPVVSWCCRRLIADEKKSRGKADPLYLDEKELNSPVIALASAARETLHIAEMVEKMFADTIEVFEQADDKQIRKISRADNDIDHIYNEIKLYMTKLSQESLDPKEADRYIQILTYATNLEHIGDIIDKSLMDMAHKAMEQKTSFSKAGFTEIKNFHSHVLQNMRMAQAIFMSEDPKLAAMLVADKESIRDAAEETAREHFKRLQSGTKASIETSAMHLDIIRDMRRINSYTTRLAYAIIENAKKYEDRRKS